MGAPRFYTPVPIGTESAGAVIELDESAAHHAARVLRLAAGDAVTLLDGTGGEFDATLERIDKRGATVRVLRFVPVERESPTSVTTTLRPTSRGSRPSTRFPKRAGAVTRRRSSPSSRASSSRAASASSS